jgi:hypothetical protein
MEATLKQIFTICEPYTHQGLFIVQPYNFQPNLIWCDGTFNAIKKDGWQQQKQHKSWHHG